MIRILPILILLSGCEVLGSKGDNQKTLNIRAGATAGDATCYIEGINAKAGTDRYLKGTGAK